MYLEHRKENDGLIIYIRGELGNFEAKSILKEVDLILDLYENDNIVLDMQKVTFMDSSGIAVIMKIVKKSKGKREFIVRNAPDMCMKIFRASGIIKFVNFV